MAGAAGSRRGGRLAGRVRVEGDRRGLRHALLVHVDHRVLRALAHAAAADGAAVALLSELAVGAGRDASEHVGRSALVADVDEAV